MWFLDHGNDYGDRPLGRGSAELNTLWRTAATALNTCHGAGATIHLRGCCDALSAKGDTGNNASNITAIAALTGHCVTGSPGEVDYYSMLGYVVSPFDAPYHASEGYLIATPIYDDFNGTVSVSTNRYYGYKTSVYRTVHVAGEGVVQTVTVLRPIYQGWNWIY